MANRGHGDKEAVTAGNSIEPRALAAYMVDDHSQHREATEEIQTQIAFIPCVMPCTCRLKAADELWESGSGQTDKADH